MTDDHTSDLIDAAITRHVAEHHVVSLPSVWTEQPTDFPAEFTAYKNEFTTGHTVVAPVRANVFSNLREYVKNRRAKAKA